VREHGADFTKGGYAQHELWNTHGVSGLTSFSRKFERVHLAPLAGRGRIAMGMRSIASAIRVRGRVSMGGARDKSIVDALNHRCRVVFSGAPSPGVRAFHAGTPTSPRARGEVRERLAGLTARIWGPGSG
jgi:hypothetical protein